MHAPHARDDTSRADPGSRSAEGERSVVLRGRSKGLEVILDGGASASDLAAELEAKLEEAPHFFAGGEVNVAFDGRLPAGALGRVEEIAGRYAMRVVSVRPQGEAPARGPGAGAAAAPASAGDAAAGSGADDPDPAREGDGAARGTASGVPAPKMVAGPVRSGTVLEAPGNVVIVGDVNPGAEVAAAGNIVVLGTLRGVAHAARGGDAGFVIALSLAPQQLRIGALIARAGDADRPSGGAEIAYAKGGQILVESYRGKIPGGLRIAAR